MAVAILFSETPAYLEEVANIKWANMANRLVAARAI
jgi:hypothetical protein